MKQPFIIAEAAQGYEGDPTIAKLLVRGAAKAGADAIKFQIVFADDLAAPGYRWYDLFRQLEMSAADWGAVRDLARELGIGFYADIFGPRAHDLARGLDIDGVKIHSTCFYETGLTDDLLAAYPKALISLGGIETAEIDAFFERIRPIVSGKDGLVLMHGYQAEPTPTGKNALSRIPALRQRFGVEVGFMDHSDGAGPDTVTLSAMALALGVTTFEKHISLDRRLELEDFVSALAPDAFAAYVDALRRLADAMGDGALDLSAEERTYRGKALKRTLAARALPRGQVLSAGDIVLKRPAAEAGAFDPATLVGRRLTRDLAENDPLSESDIE